MAQRQWRSDDTDVWKDRFGNGSDGAGSAPANVQTTFTGTSGQTTGTAGSGTGFAAGNLILIHQSRNGGSGVGKWEFNKISSVGGGTDWTLAYALTNTYDTTAQVYLMKQFASYNGTLAVPTSWDGTKGGIAGFFCKGDAVITGGNSNAKGYRGGPAGVDQVWSGEGTQGAFVSGWSTARDSGGSGGGGSERNGSNVAGGGGGGGNGAAGQDGTTHGTAGYGLGGDQVGAADLTVAVFGGGGGLGTGSVGQDGAPGGAGGGLIVVVAKTITFSGATTNKGGDGTASDGNHCGGGGAGAGGSVLLKGQTITLGSTLLDATGGTGGNHDSDSSNNGGNGGTGRIHADYSKAISGTTSPAIDSRQDATIKTLGGPKVIFFA